jgi:hypothetical protein
MIVEGGEQVNYCWTDTEIAKRRKRHEQYAREMVDTFEANLSLNKFERLMEISAYLDLAANKALNETERAICRKPMS